MIRKSTHRVTLAQVAEDSSVSVTTASLILSGRPESLAQFQAQTIERVRRSAEELGYRSNLFASSLLSERSSFFALVVRGGHSDDPEAWQYGVYDSELLYGVTETAPADVYPVTAMLGPQLSEAKVRSVERIMGGGVFGTIVRTPNSLLEQRLRPRIKRGHPTVVVFPERLDDWPQNAIDADNVAIGQLAGKLLWARGCKRWLVLSDAKYQAGQSLRESGSQAAATKLGAEHDTLELPADSSLAQLEQLVSERIREWKPDGIFGMTLTGVASSMAASRRLGFQMGREVALVGCDCAFRSQPPEPRVTSIDVSWFDVGAAAIRQLVRMSEGGESRFKTILLPPRVIEGETCPVPANLRT